MAVWSDPICGKCSYGHYKVLIKNMNLGKVYLFAKMFNILRVWTSILVSGLVFGCLDLYLGVWICILDVCIVVGCDYGVGAPPPPFPVTRPFPFNLKHSIRYSKYTGLTQNIPSDTVSI